MTAQSASGAIENRSRPMTRDEKRVILASSLGTVFLSLIHISEPTRPY